MNAIKSYLRHLSKNKLYTSVTVLGFAISLSFVLVLSVYVANELAVDDFHENKDRIFRIENEDVSFSPPIADDLKNTIPEIEDFTRTLEGSGRINASNGQKLEVHYLGVDSSFFEIFSFHLIRGMPQDVLQTVNGIVLSKSMAIKLFGSTDAVGKSVYLETDHKFIVTGIMEDFPENTHFIEQDALLNLKAFEGLWGFKDLMKAYGFASLSIYFLEKNNADLPSKAPEILETFKKEYWIYKEGWAHTVVFTPLKELYFSHKSGSGTKSNSKTLITVLSVIVFLIVLLSVGNYINLTVAQATFRGKEVAIKKLLGSSRKQLFLQFIRESVLLCFIALILAFCLVKFIEPIFNSLLNTRLEINNKINLSNLVVLTIAFVFIGIVAGILPALKIASFNPIEAVKGSFRTKVKSVYGKAFITFQYTVTIALLICSWMILRQTTFLRNKDLGFQKDNIAHIEYLGTLGQKAAIKNALLQIPGVEDVSLTWQSPLSGGSNQTFDFNGRSVSFLEFAVDSSFFNVFDIRMKPTGVAFSAGGVYLNESAIKELGLVPPFISFQMGEEEKPILGVVNDFNFKELRDQIGPLMLRQQSEDSYAKDIFLKIRGGNAFEAIDKIKDMYAGLVDDAEFELKFVDETINGWYEKEERTGKIIGYFTLLSLIISVMGIVAISTFYMQQRRKEISIRKVNGASITQILSLLNKDYVKWVGLAFIIAVPVSWFSMNQWLQGFAYKITMPWWIFALAGIATLIMALLTVGWQSFMAAQANPVKSLRTE
jgi:putative ABC transport system permease protein